MEKESRNKGLDAKTLVIGIGEVGGALAEALERTAPVLRHDLERVEFDCPIGVMHICIPFSAQAKFVEIALSYIERFRPQLTIINSTVVPGTTRLIAQKSNTRVAFSPVRGKHAHMVQDLFRYNKFVAALEVETADAAESHFAAAGFKTSSMKKLEGLELAKLAETTYFGVLISFAQELSRYAKHLAVDYYESTDFFDEIDFLPRAKYYPGFIGGHCVIPNIRLLKQVRDSELLNAILSLNEEFTYEAKNSDANSKSRAAATTADVAGPR